MIESLDIKPPPLRKHPPVLAHACSLGRLAHETETQEQDDERTHKIKTQEDLSNLFTPSINTYFISCMAN